MVKEIYLDNRRKVVVIIMVVLDLFLVSCSIPLFLGGYFFIGLPLVISAVIFTIVFSVLNIYFSNMKKNNNEIVEKGYKVNGEVISIGHKRHRRREGANHHYYWLDIKYIDKDGLEHIYKSPYLGFEPKGTYDITCDVYIYNNQVYATNFVNLYKDKTRDKFEIVGLIVALVIVGVMIIASQI